MSHDYTSIEDLLLATLDAVSRFRVGQREAVNAALEAGGAANRSQGAAATWGVGRLAWKGRPCEANGVLMKSATVALLWAYHSSLVSLAGERPPMGKVAYHNS